MTASHSQLLDEWPAGLAVGHVRRRPRGPHWYACRRTLQAEFNNDIEQASAAALGSTELAAGLNPQDKDNAWALFDDFIDRVAAQCVTALRPKWSGKLAAFDVYIWDQCYAMEQSLRIDE